MDPQLEDRIKELSQKIDAVYVSVEKTRRYFLIILWVTVLTVVLPIIVLVFALPAFLNSYMGVLGM